MKNLTSLLVILLLTTSCTSNRWFPSRINYTALEPSKNTVQWLRDNNAPTEVFEDVARCKLDARVANRTNEVDKPVAVIVDKWYTGLLDFAYDTGKWLWNKTVLLFSFFV